MFNGRKYRLTCVCGYTVEVDRAFLVDFDPVNIESPRKSGKPQKLKVKQ